MERWLITVHGRVQGVGFRRSVFNFVLDQKLPLKGHVKNLLTGEVEILAEGIEEHLKLLEEFCYKGPILSKVIKVEVKVLENQNLELTNFSIQY